VEDSRIEQKSSQGQTITAAHAFVKAMLRLGLLAPLVARKKRCRGLRSKELPKKHF